MSAYLKSQQEPFYTIKVSLQTKLILFFMQYWNVCFIWWGHLSLTWDQPIANHDHPINSPETQSSFAHICSCSRSVSLRYTAQYGRKFPLMKCSTQYINLLSMRRQQRPSLSSSVLKNNLEMSALFMWNLHINRETIKHFLPQRLYKP